MSIYGGDEYPNQFFNTTPSTDANVGTLNQFSLPIRVSSSANNTTGVAISSGAGAPTIGGNLNDLWVRSDAVAETSYFYRCTTAGVAGAAVWTAMSGA